MKTVLLVDAFAVIHRAFHALPDFTAPDGTHVNVLYGFVSTLLKAVRDVQPDYLVVAFDLPGPTLRHEVFKDYKAQRPETPPALSGQVPLVKEAVESMGLPVVAQEGYEAEDLIATFITKTASEDFMYVILTGDRDTLQLARNNVSIYFLKKGLSDVILVDAAKVKELYGVTPAQFTDVKALRGDPSDNIPGVVGIGEKTALELVQQYGSAEHIFANIKRLPDRPQRLLAGQKELVAVNKRLVTITDDAPLLFKLPDFQRSEGALEKTIPILERYGMKSLVARIRNKKTEAPVPKRSRSASASVQESLL